MYHFHVLHRWWRFFVSLTGCFQTIEEINFLDLHLRTCFCCQYGILENNDLSPNCQSVLRRVREISLTCFLLISVLKERCEHDPSLSKQSQIYRAFSCRSRNIEWRQKGAFDFTEIVKSHRLKRGTICQIVRFISHFSLIL